MIRLLNRRFVPFYYNTDNGRTPLGEGKDPAAKAFTKTKTKNPWAFFAAFTAAGEPVGVSDVYADKDVTFDFLVALLRENPEFDRYTKEEEAILARADAAGARAAARAEAGQLLEDLGRYPDAKRHFLAALRAGDDPAAVAEAHRGLLRMARHGRDWAGLEARLREIEALAEPAAKPLGLGPDVAMERAFRLLAEKKYAEARALLHDAIKKYPDSKRQSEFHFSAGVASFFLKEKDRAYFHWCHVAETLPDDRLARRCYIAAAHEGMPYDNPELGGFRAAHAAGNIDVIRRAYERAKRVYDELKDKP